MKKHDIEVDAQERQMLELLARGQSSREIAAHMGYREGTMRVYLHELYRKLGVANKTNAVIWWIDRQAGPKQVVLEGPDAGEGPGELAVRRGLAAMLGAHAMFVGGHSRVWEASRRLKGEKADASAESRRRASRVLWEALLGGDFALARRMVDDGRADLLQGDSPADGVALCAMLAMGGYTGRAQRLIAQVGRRRRAGSSVTPKEFVFLQLLLEAMEKSSDEPLAGLHHLAGDAGAAVPLRHLAIVGLHHAYLTRGDRERAAAVATALWCEAETQRQALAAMGERPLPKEAALPPPPKGGREQVRAALDKLKAARVAA